MSDITNIKTTETLEHKEIQPEKFVSFDGNSDFCENKSKKKHSVFICCVPKEKTDYQYTKNA